MWCAMLNRPIAGPAPCVAANTKAIRPPTPATHMLAASAPARPSARPSAPRRSRVARPPTAPMAAPADTPSSSSAMSLPPPGTECRNMTAAAATASTGTARDRRSRECSRIWRTTIRTRIALITYMLMFMPSACRAAPIRGVGPRAGVRVDTDLHPRVDPGRKRSRYIDAYARNPRGSNARTLPLPGTPNYGSGAKAAAGRGSAAAGPGRGPDGACPWAAHAGTVSVRGTLYGNTAGRKGCTREAVP